MSVTCTSEATMEVVLTCMDCGDELDGQFKRGNVQVYPCKGCMAAAKKEGVDSVEA